MGKRAVGITEIKILTERLMYLAGNLKVAEGYYISEKAKKEILLHLGYDVQEYEKDGEKKERFICQKTGTNSLKLTYLQQYKECAKKLSEFYEVLDKMPNERLKFIAELRYVEGYAWKEIAKRIGESIQTIYGYRSVILKILRENNLEWVLRFDSLCE